MRSEQQIINAINYHEQLLIECFQRVVLNERGSQSEFMCLSMGIYNLRLELNQYENYSKAA